MTITSSLRFLYILGDLAHGVAAPTYRTIQFGVGHEKNQNCKVTVNEKDI